MQKPAKRTMDLSPEVEEGSGRQSSVPHAETHSARKASFGNSTEESMVLEFEPEKHRGTDTI